MTNVEPCPVTSQFEQIVQNGYEYGRPNSASCGYGACDDGTDPPLDNLGVPVPKTWWKRTDIKAETWKTALRNNASAVKKAIRDRLKAVAKAKIPEAGTGLSPTSAEH